jgi:hypothetical protein
VGDVYRIPRTLGEELRQDVDRLRKARGLPPVDLSAALTDFPSNESPASVLRCLERAEVWWEGRRTVLAAGTTFAVGDYGAAQIDQWIREFGLKFERVAPPAYEVEARFELPSEPEKPAVRNAFVVSIEKAKRLEAEKAEAKAKREAEAAAEKREREEAEKARIAALPPPPPAPRPPKVPTLPVPEETRALEESIVESIYRPELHKMSKDAAEKAATPHVPAKIAGQKPVAKAAPKAPAKKVEAKPAVKAQR